QRRLTADIGGGIRSRGAVTRQRCLSRVQGGTKIAIVKLNEEIAGLDHLIVIDGHRGDLTSDAWCDCRIMDTYIGIVGPDIGRRHVDTPQYSGGACCDDGTCQKPRPAGSPFLHGGRFYLGGLDRSARRRGLARSDAKCSVGREDRHHSLLISWQTEHVADRCARGGSPPAP